MEAAIALPATPARVDTRDTSSAALASVGAREMSKSLQVVYDVIALGMRRGRADMSLQEIQELYESTNPGKRMDLNRVSARVADLVAAKRVARKSDTRPCSRSGKPIHPVYIEPTQPRLFA